MTELTEARPGLRRLTAPHHGWWAVAEPESPAERGALAPAWLCHLNGPEPADLRDALAAAVR
jgi:hypothetical protein